VFLKNEFRTVDPVTPVWKLRPSATWSTTIVSLIVVPDIGPSNQSPTLVCWMYRPSIVESLIAPPTPLTWSVSTRSRTSPRIANPDRCTSCEPPLAASLP